MTSPSGLFVRLGAPLANVQWAWGAERPDGTIFLRAWADETAPLEAGSRFIRLANHAAYANDPDNLGYRERRRHLQALRDGASGYVVLCVAENPSIRPRSIKSFDARQLLKLGKLVEHEGDEWAKIVGRVNVRDALTSTALSG